MFSSVDNETKVEPVKNQQEDAVSSGEPNEPHDKNNGNNRDNLKKVGKEIVKKGTPLLDQVLNENEKSDSGNKNTHKTESTIWQNLSPYKGKIKTNEKTGKNKRYFTWDYEHGGEIEVFDSRGYHIGTIEPKTGKQIKDAVQGRNIKKNIN